MPARRTVRSRRLGRALAALRSNTCSQEELAAQVSSQLGGEPIGQWFISRAESGAGRLTREQLAAILEILGATRTTADRLEQLRLRVDQPGWWYDYHDLLDEAVEMLVELGEDATTIATYDTVHVQGLLQVPAYSDAVLGATTKAYVAPPNVSRLSDLRVARSRRLHAPGFGGLRSVMTEEVLLRDVGGPQVRREQLRHLHELGSDPDVPVTIYILPRGSGALPGQEPFCLFGFNGAGESDEEQAHVAVYVDSDTAPRVYEHGDASFQGRNPIRQCTYTWDAALAQALPALESLELIKTLMKEK